MITIVDYGMGNLRSVEKALETLSVPCRISANPKDIESADAILLPGVGAFDAAISTLRSGGLNEAIKKAVLGGTPYLGICLGLQLLFEESDEGSEPGLGIFKGAVPKFKFENRPDLKIPHMGWNNLDFAAPSPLFKGINKDAKFYFVHSYYAAPADADIVSSTTDYGGPFCSSVWKDNVLATQFHPEKSGAVGFQVLRNFDSWVKELKR